MVGRYVRFCAASGAGDEVAALMLDVAHSLRDTPGCRLYVVSRDIGEPDTVWVTELWDDETSVQASLAQLQSDEGKARLTEIMSRLTGPPQRTDLTPVGGVGPGLD